MKLFVYVIALAIVGGTVSVHAEAVEFPLFPELTATPEKIDESLQLYNMTVDPVAILKNVNEKIPELNEKLKNVVADKNKDDPIVKALNKIKKKAAKTAEKLGEADVSVATQFNAESALAKYAMNQLETNVIPNLNTEDLKDVKEYVQNFITSSLDQVTELYVGHLG